MSASQQLLKYSPHINVVSGDTLLAGFTSVISVAAGQTATLTPPAVPALASGKAYFTFQNTGPGTATITGLGDIVGVGQKTFTVNAAGSAWVNVPPSLIKEPDYAAIWIESTAYLADQTFSIRIPAIGVFKDANNNPLENGVLYNLAYPTAQTSGATFNVAEAAKTNVIEAASGTIEYSYGTSLVNSAGLIVSSGLTMAKHVTSRQGNIGIIPCVGTLTTGTDIKTAFGIPATDTIRVRFPGQSNITIANTDTFPIGIFAFSYAGTTLTADKWEGSGYLYRKRLLTNGDILQSQFEYHFGRASPSDYVLPTITQTSQIITFFNANGVKATFTLQTATDTLDEVANGTFISNVKGQYVLFIAAPQTSAWRAVPITPSVLTGTGNALPANNATYGLFVLIGHSSLPSGTYWYDTSSTSWVQL